MQCFEIYGFELANYPDKTYLYIYFNESTSVCLSVYMSVRPSVWFEYKAAEGAAFSRVYIMLNRQFKFG